MYMDSNNTRKSGKSYGSTKKILPTSEEGEHASDWGMHLGTLSIFTWCWGYQSGGLRFKTLLWKQAKPLLEIGGTSPEDTCQKSSSPTLGDQLQVWVSFVVALNMDRSVSQPDYNLRREKSKEVGITESWHVWGTGMPLYHLCNKVRTEDAVRRGYYVQVPCWSFYLSICP